MISVINVKDVVAYIYPEIHGVEYSIHCIGIKIRGMANHSRKSLFQDLQLFRLKFNKYE